MFAGMELLEFISEPSKLDALAKKLDTSPAYLRQIAKRFRGRTCGPKMAIRIEAATDGEVTRNVLRPDIWPSGKKAA